MFKIGDRVKALKWRDGGETAEALYIGKIIEREDGGMFVVRIAKSNRGWKKGDQERQSMYNLVLMPPKVKGVQELPDKFRSAYNLLSADGICDFGSEYDRLWEEWIVAGSPSPMAFLLDRIGRLGNVQDGEDEFWATYRIVSGDWWLGSLPPKEYTYLRKEWEEAGRPEDMEAFVRQRIDATLLNRN